METTKDCVFIKRKEYDELLAIKESKKPDSISLYLYYYPRGNHGTIDFYDTINISGKLHYQIARIIRMLREKLVDYNDTIIKEAIEEYVSASRKQKRYIREQLNIE